MGVGVLPLETILYLEVHKSNRTLWSGYLLRKYLPAYPPVGVVLEGEVPRAKYTGLGRPSGWYCT